MTIARYARPEHLANCPRCSAQVHLDRAPVVHVDKPSHYAAGWPVVACWNCKTEMYGVAPKGGDDAR